MRFINESDIDFLLKKMLGFGMVTSSDNFTISVMDRIRGDIDSTVKLFNALSFRFIIGSSAFMAASMLFAVNIYSQYTADIPEFALYEFFSFII